MGFGSRILFLQKKNCMHFRYRHRVGDHKNRRHSPISIEKICTKGYELIGTLLGTWQCQLLMPILRIANFKVRVN